MNDATPAHEYAAGEWTAVAADGLLALVAPGARPDVATGLWDVAGDGGDVLSALGVVAAAGFADLPQFAVVTTQRPGAVRAVLRGPVELRVRTADGEQVLAAREDAVWTEHRAEGVEALELRAGGGVPADAPWWPLLGGVVRADAVRLVRPGAPRPAGTGTAAAGAGTTAAGDDDAAEEASPAGGPGTAVTADDLAASARAASAPEQEPEQEPALAPEQEQEPEQEQGPAAGSVGDEPAPVATEPEPAAEQQAPVAEEPEPVVAEAEPVAEEPEPVPADREPAADEPEPVTAHAEPVTEDPEHPAGEPEPVVEHPAPVAEDLPHAADLPPAPPAAPAPDVPPLPDLPPLPPVPAPVPGSAAPASLPLEPAPAGRADDALALPLTAGTEAAEPDVHDTVLQDGWWQSSPASDPLAAPPAAVDPWAPPAAAAAAPAAAQDLLDPADDDHDGMTILSSDLARLRDRLPAWTHDAVPGPFPTPEPTPLPARLVLSTGVVVDLDRAVLLGRAPQVSRVTARELPRLVTVPSPNQDISRTHAEVRLEGDHVVVTDLDSTNGVHVSRPGEGVRRLHAGEPSVVATDEVVDLGDGVTFTVERTA